MKKLRSNKCNLAVMFMIIFILIVIIILGVFLYFRYYRGFAESDEVKTESEETVPSTEEKEEMTYEQIKKDIATGKLDKIPEGIDKTKRLVIKEYLYGCYIMDDINKKLECYEDHFLTDPEFKRQKDDCEQKQGDEKTQCLDQFYFKLANEKQFEFCNVVIDSDLKEKCAQIG